MSLWQRMRNLGRRDRVDAEIADELAAHIELAVEEAVRDGVSEQEARRAARLRFGNPVLIKEKTAGADLTLSLDALARDLRFASRQLRRSPGFAVTAIVTLALGIAANVLVFSVLDALLLRPLHLPQPNSLFLVEHREHGSWYQSYPDYLDYRDRNTSFSGMAAYVMDDMAVGIGRSVLKSYGYFVSGNYFDVLGIEPATGRLFHQNDERGINSAPYIVFSYDFWQSRFNGDANVIGTTVALNTHPFTVIGIAPKGFHGTEVMYWPDYWVLAVNSPQIGFPNGFIQNRSTHNFWIVGRLKSGVTPQQASENLNAISRQLAQQYPDADDGLTARLVRPGLRGDVWGDPIRSFLGAIMALASLVLLAACANLGSIFAARAADRSRELAIRLAIGASRGRLLRILLTEAVLVSLFAGVAGTLFSTLLLELLSRWQPFVNFPIHVVVAPDAKVYALALLLSLGSGVFFGLLPARQVWQSDATQVMKAKAGTVPVLRRFALRDLLLCVQIALCTLLVTASLVAVRGMERSLHAPLGFQPQGVTIAQTQLNLGGYSEEQYWGVERRMAEEAARIPGGTAAGISDRVMLDSDCCGNMSVYRDGTTELRPTTEAFHAYFFSASPGYFDAAGTRLLAGRDIRWTDDEHAPEVAVVNQTFAHRLFANAPAVGRHFLLYGKRREEIVGVVEDGKYATLTENPQPAMFFALAQHVTNNDTAVLVRSNFPSSEIAKALERVVTGIDPRLPLMIRSWPDELDLALFPARAATGALGIMGLLAAMLAVTGIFGMAAYTVSRRMRELGIRVALGARRGGIVKAAVGRPAVLLVTGSALGLIGGVFASSLLEHIVYEADPRNPMVIGGALATMALLGLLASWIPAVRALRVDPSMLMREE